MNPIDELKATVTDEIEAIKKDTLSNVFLEIKKRLTFCIEVQGGSFEQYF